MTTTVNGRLISYDEVCADLGGIGKTKLHELLNAGLLKRVRIGRRAFVSRDSLDTYVESLSA